MEKFQNKYRIASARLAGWDYGSPGLYFITICTKNKEHYFGEIINNEMYLNDIGIIADKYWAEIPHHFQYVTLGEFVIMPNHVHGIIIIETVADTGHALCLHNIKQPTISNMIGSFKSAVTKSVNLINKQFVWQTRFHDHIIRNNESFVRISNYILNNPSNWKEDKYSNS